MLSYKASTPYFVYKDLSPCVLILPYSLVHFASEFDIYPDTEEYWKYADVDSFLLILPKKNIPKEKHNKITQLRRKMIEFKELLEKYKGYYIINDTSKIVTLNTKIAGLLKDVQKLTEDLDVGYIQKKMEAEYKEACK